MKVRPKETDKKNGMTAAKDAHLAAESPENNYGTATSSGGGASGGFGSFQPFLTDEEKEEIYGGKPSADKPEQAPDRIIEKGSA